MRGILRYTLDIICDEVRIRYDEKTESAGDH